MSEVDARKDDIDRQEIAAVSCPLSPFISLQASLDVMHQVESVRRANTMLFRHWFSCATLEQPEGHSPLKQETYEVN